MALLLGNLITAALRAVQGLPSRCRTALDQLDSRRATAARAAHPTHIWKGRVVLDCVLSSDEPNPIRYMLTEREWSELEQAANAAGKEKHA
jgi:hypothetical protein